MAQPLLALGALMVLSVFALNQQQSALRLQTASHAREAERVVLEVASDVMAQITRPGILFDRAFARLENPLAHRGAGVALTPPELFGAAAKDGAPPASFQAVEDFVAYPAAHEAAWGEGVLPVRVAVSVRYVRVDPATQAVRESASPTYTKEVTVTVREVVSAGARRPPAEATLTRLLTPTHLSLH